MATEIEELQNKLQIEICVQLGLKVYSPIITSFEEFEKTFTRSAKCRFTRDGVCHYTVEKVSCCSKCPAFLEHQLSKRST